MNPQATTIYEILKDGNWHCPIEWGYADGHAKRITDINKFLEPQDKKVIGDWCDCGKHKAKVLKRKIVDGVKDVFKTTATTNVSYKTCCNSWIIFKEHARDCQTLKVKENKLW